MLKWLKSKLRIEVEPSQTSSGQDNLPELLDIDSTTSAAIERINRRNHCNCFTEKTKKGKLQVPRMHEEVQVEASAWPQTVDLMLSIAKSNITVFEPSSHIIWEEWMQMITLPKALQILDKVKEVRLYGSHLRRLPPEIGRMSSLTELDIYTSYSLHWLPYEVLRCRNLKDSRMSTRTLYGNKKTRLPFPRLSKPIPSLEPATCSVCDRAFDGCAPQLYWTTQRVGSDNVPLLIHSCSTDCVKSIRSAPQGFFERPHKGGGGVGMPLVNSDH